jgi:hypothetical protein
MCDEAEHKILRTIFTRWVVSQTKQTDEQTD